VSRWANVSIRSDKAGRVHEKLNDNWLDWDPRVTASTMRNTPVRSIPASSRGTACCPMVPR
jgi:hypothetical protein